MNPWRPYPLIRLIFPFITGVLASVLHLIEIRIPFPVVAGTVILATALAVFPSWLSSYRARIFRGGTIFLSLFFLGNQLALDHLPGYFFREGIRYPEKEELFLARITETAVQRTRTVRFTGELFRVDTLSSRCEYYNTAVFYVETDRRSGNLRNGDLVLVSGKPGSFPAPGVPGSFDMAKHYFRKGVFCQLYLPSGKWRLIKNEQGLTIRKVAEGVRNRLLDVLRENRVEGEEFAVAAALLLGYVSGIDKELMHDYSSSGAMHILSVSGMHVGIIYLFLEFVLGLPERRRRGNPVFRWFKAVVMILSIWSYALITGFSPPVQRAALMLSLVIAGKNLKRQPDILNILAASLFIVLASDPFLVLDVGCQFSYLAVAGIVLLHKPVYDLFVTSWWIPDKIWSLSAVSLVAQVATFPLGLFVFHQFPNYFLLTNLVAVPLSSLIIYAGIILLAAGQVPWLGPLTGQALSWMVRLLNQVVRIIDSLPGSTLSGIVPDLYETILLYLAVIFLSMFLLRKKKAFLFLLAGSVILLSASGLGKTIRNRGGAEVFVYHGKATLVDFISGNGHFLLMQDPLRPPDDYTKNALVNHWASKDIVHHFSGYLKHDMADTAVQESPELITRHGNYLLFCGKRFVVLNKRLHGEPEKPLETDVLIVCNGVRMSKEELKKWFNSGMVIMPGKQGYTLISLP